MGWGCFAMVATAGEKRERDRDRGAASLPSQCPPSAPRPLAQCEARREAGAGRAGTAAVRGAAPGAATGCCHRSSRARGPLLRPRGLFPPHIRSGSAAPPRPSAVARPGPAPPGGGDAAGPAVPARRRSSGRRSRRPPGKCGARPCRAGGLGGATLALGRARREGCGAASPCPVLSSALRPGRSRSSKLPAPGGRAGAPPRPGLSPHGSVPPGSCAALPRACGALAVRDKRRGCSSAHSQRMDPR